METNQLATLECSAESVLDRYLETVRFDARRMAAAHIACLEIVKKYGDLYPVFIELERLRRTVHRSSLQYHIRRAKMMGPRMRQLVEHNIAWTIKGEFRALIHV